MKDGDFIEHLFVCSSHDYLLFFSNRGKVYRSKVYELPEASRTAKGRALVNILPLREGERIQAVLSTRDFTEAKYLVFATRNGHRQEDRARSPTTRRSRPTGSSRSTSATTTSCSPCARVDPRRRDHHGLARRADRALRRVRRARDGPRHDRRARAWTSARSGEVIAMDVARDDMDLLVVTENGYGKRTQIGQYRKTNRGAKGVKTIGLTEKKGGLAGALVVREHQELVFISVGGMVQRTAGGGISQQGRSATGRARDEPQGRRHRQRRRARRRRRRRATAPTVDRQRRLGAQPATSRRPRRSRRRRADSRAPTPSRSGPTVAQTGRRSTRRQPQRVAQNPACRLRRLRRGGRRRRALAQRPRPRHRSGAAAGSPLPSSPAAAPAQPARAQEAPARRAATSASAARSRARSAGRRTRGATGSRARRRASSHRCNSGRPHASRAPTPRSSASAAASAGDCSRSQRTPRRSPRVLATPCENTELTPEAGRPGARARGCALPDQPRARQNRRERRCTPTRRSRSRPPKSHSAGNDRRRLLRSTSRPAARPRSTASATPATSPARTSAT